MGRSSKSEKKHRDRTRSSSPSASASSSPSSLSSFSDGHISKRRKRNRSRRRQRDDDYDGDSRREKDRRRDRKSRRRELEKDTEGKYHHKRRSRREGKKRVVKSDDESESSGEDSSEPRSRSNAKAVTQRVLKKFPGVAGDLQQLLQMIDDGQAVDIREISERSLTKHLKKLFKSLNLKESGDGVFLLPSNVRPTWEVVGPIICLHIETKEEWLDHPISTNDLHSTLPEVQCKVMNDESLTMPHPEVENSAPRRRMIGPEMPSAELLAAAAKLTEAEAELRDAKVEEDTELFIGPPPPAVVAEAESANEAERFEEVSRIMGVEVDSPYDVLGVNQNMSSDNLKKRYWKLSLMVHPDKCSHPQAHQAFIILNKAFKDLQDPNKRKAVDDKIKIKEEQEEFKAELRAMREAAQWRRLQGISMEGDDELLAEMEVKVGSKRDEWMTTLPPERKPGMTMQSTKFSRSTKGRGDTSVWTDTPSDRAEKAKMNYLEAYNEAAALASNEEEKMKARSDADLVEKYNKARRPKSLVQKHQEEFSSHSKRKSKQLPPEKEEWVGKHPWKPWDREKDLTAGQKSIKFDSDSMAQGLTSRFSSGTFQKNFL
ncbi:uncharacterized protein LOC131162924 [Malania oleifera]|uniref:uncharacterized protein LOC131162924 n=1 Tax=Malania oleifera TaxID=397392 RepID=UPI0025ADD7F0|nr:uncharacterized protein LOC131162924 [Malania oleifera]